MTTLPETPDYAPELDADCEQLVAGCIVVSRPLWHTSKPADCKPHGKYGQHKPRYPCKNCGQLTFERHQHFYVVDKESGYWLCDRKETP